MMLRSRSNNVNNGQINAAGGKGGNVQGDGPTKRFAKQQPLGEPLAKRAVLNEISNGISNFLIDSSKKIGINKKPLKQRGPGKRSNSASEEFTIPEDSEFANDDEVQILQEVKKSVAPEDPAPEFDFDQQCSINKDEFSVPAFAFDIFRYYRSRESSFAVDDYLVRHPKLSKDVRAVLVDWMVEVQESFELNHETLYLSVKMLDMYLSRTKDVKKDDLQLIASACVFIASKFDERSPPLIDDFMYLCEDNFTRDQLIHMEMNVLNIVGFDLGCPLSYRYLRRYARVTSTDMPTLTLSRYIMELSLCFYEFVGVRESLLASAAFFLSLKMKDRKAQWTPILHKYSGYTAHEIEPLVLELNHMLHLRAAGVGPKIATVNSKYSHPVFHEVAVIPLLSDKFDTSRPLMKEQQFVQQ